MDSSTIDHVMQWQRVHRCSIVLGREEVNYNNGESQRLGPTQEPYTINEYSIGAETHVHSHTPTQHCSAGRSYCIAYSPSSSFLLQANSMHGGFSMLCCCWQGLSPLLFPFRSFVECQAGTLPIDYTVVVSKERFRLLFHGRKTTSSRYSSQ